MTRLALGPLCVDAVTEEDVAAFIDSRVRNAERARLVTLNAEMFVQSMDAPRLGRLVTGADLIVADSIGIVWAARLLAGAPLRRLPGIDLIDSVCALARDRGYGIFLLGGRGGTPAAAARRLGERFPGLRIAGTHHGYFSDADEGTVLDTIAAARPDIILAGMGFPKQEEWAERASRRLPPAVVIGVGGSLDILSGSVPRAPVPIRRAGLEWLFRLINQPVRVRRILTRLPRFVSRVILMKTGSGRTGRR